MKKRILFLIIILFSITPIFSAGTKESEYISTYSFTDSYNRTVTLKENPTRIISLGPNISEIISALNFDKLVGRTDYCDYPEKISTIPSIGNITNPNIEKIIELKPDLVIGSAHCPKELLDTLVKMNIPSVAIYDDSSFEGSFNIINTVGKLINEEDKAKEIVENNKNTIAKIVNETKDLDKKTVYYAVSFGEWGDFTAGGNTFIGQMIDLVGGINIAQDITGWNYSIEQLIEKDPQIIIVSKYFDSKNQFINTKPYSSLTAVKENRVFEIDNNLLDREGIRNAEGLKELAKIIHYDDYKTE